jgi:hypothetical protein
MSLPLVRSHERMDYKRCPKKWYWKWRLGLVPKAYSFGPLNLGEWMHLAFNDWYLKGTKRSGQLVDHFNRAADSAIELAASNNAPEHELEKAEELAELGSIMATAYQDHYGLDDQISVIGGEIPLEFSIADSGKVIAKHLLKPDLVFRYKSVPGKVYLMEHKTAKSITTEHLVMDDQARPYGVMSERALKNAGLIDKDETVAGILYNFLRKGLPDNRQRNAQGQYLNKNGSVSKRQPKPLFVRKLITLTRAAKLVSLKRIQAETVLITAVTKGLRDKRIDPVALPKTQHKSCSRFCQYFDMCVAEENGLDISDMRRLMYVRQNPYEQYDTTDEPIGFEMG